MTRKCGPRGTLTGPGGAQSGQSRNDPVKGANRGQPGCEREKDDLEKEQQGAAH